MTQPRSRPFSRRLVALAVGQALLLSATVAGANTITIGSGCTLVDAVTAANSDTATGSCPAGSGADTIVLAAAATYTLNSAQPGGDPAAGYTALPLVTSTITITGNSATIAASGAFRLFAVISSGDLTLNSVTLSGGSDSSLSGGGAVMVYGGSFTANNSTFSHNTAKYGGAISALDGGSATLSGSTVSNNIATELGGGIAIGGGTLHLTDSTVSGNETSDGGGVWSNGTFTLTSSTISGNTAHGSGGALLNRGTTTAIDATLTGNYAAAYGGAIESYEGTLTLSDCLIQGNTAQFAGAVETYATATVTGCTVSGNTAIYGAGAFSAYSGGADLLIVESEISGNSSGAEAGGVFVYGGQAALVNSTVSNNAADGGGGGIYSVGTLTLNSVTVANNTTNGTAVGRRLSRSGHASDDNQFGPAAAPPNIAGGVSAYGSETVINTIIAGNTGYDCAGTIESLGSALIEDGTCGASLSGDPLLGALADNGGPTRTHALSAGSPAIDVGDSGACSALTTDQRGAGYPRTVGASCDLGAFESDGSSTAIPVLTPWAMGLLASLLSAFGLGALRRRR